MIASNLLEFTVASLTESFDYLLENLFPTVHCSEEVDSKNFQKLEIVTTNSMQASRSMMVGMGAGNEGYVTPMLTAKSYISVFHDSLDYVHIPTGTVNGDSVDSDETIKPSNKRDSHITPKVASPSNLLTDVQDDEDEAYFSSTELGLLNQ